MKTIGVIGGMGALATVDLFSKIVTNTEVSCDQDHVHLLIDNNCCIPDRTAFILGIEGAKDPIDELVKSATRLKESGAEVLVMPCNTAHYFIDRIKEQVDIDFISMIETTVNVIKDKYPDSKNIAVVSTTGTKRTNLYENYLDKAGYTSIIFDEVLQSDIMASIYDGVKKGKVIEYTYLFQSVVDRIESLGADIIISACTEIPILMSSVETSIPTVDPTLELALATIRYAKG